MISRLTFVTIMKFVHQKLALQRQSRGQGGKIGKRTPVVREVADEYRPAGGGPRELSPGDLGRYLHVRPVLLDVPVDGPP